MRERPQWYLQKNPRSKANVQKRKRFNDFRHIAAGDPISAPGWIALVALPSWNDVAFRAHGSAFINLLLFSDHCRAISCLPDEQMGTTAASARAAARPRIARRNIINAAPAEPSTPLPTGNNTIVNFGDTATTLPNPLFDL
jgi:hypothetical protein